jgi:hypothetical protein
MKEEDSASVAVDEQGSLKEGAPQKEEKHAESLSAVSKEREQHWDSRLLQDARS